MRSWDRRRRHHSRYWWDPFNIPGLTTRGYWVIGLAIVAALVGVMWLAGALGTWLTGVPD